jgi:C4-dicarboxylate-specific signal transduction histidine kinase
VRAPRSSSILPFALAAVLVGAALGVVLITAPFLPYPFLILFLIPVMIASWFGGIGAGVFAVILSTIAVGYFFIEPIRAFSIYAEDVPYFAAFVVSALLASWLSASRDELETRVAARTEDLRRINVALSAEIAERKLAEDALRSTQTELAHATRVMAMGELVASIAHEINQPLTGVITNAEACLRWLDGDADLGEARAAARRIVRDGERASGVIRQLRALLKKADPQLIELDVVSVIEDVITVVRSEVRAQNVSMQFTPAANLPLVMADRVQLQQVIVNLMLNGIEAMSEVEPSRRVLSVDTRRSAAGEIRVAISDTGVGLAREDLDRIFAAFVTSKADGLGMGLSISRSIVEAHGGRLWAEDRSGSGATFVFTLPVAREEVAQDWDGPL